MIVLDSIVERLRKRFALWKRSYISNGGRLKLIKSSLACLPLYQMSLFRMALGAKRFSLGGGGFISRKPHLVRWDKVCLGK